MEKLDYYKGLVDGIIEYETCEGIHIESEKDFEYRIFERGTNGWAVEMKCIKSFEEAEFKGNWEQPEDNDTHVYYKQVLYFTYDTSVSKVIKEIIEELNSIANFPTPEVIEN